MKHQSRRQFDANMTDFAVEQMKRLPRLPTKRQDLKTLSGLVKLNRLMARASESTEAANGTLTWKKAA